MLFIESCAALLILATLAIAARNLTQVDYAELLTFRRDANVLVPIILLGLGTTLVREISILSDQNKMQNDAKILLSAGILLSMVSYVVLVLIFLVV